MARWNVIDRKTNEILSCDWCECKTFKNKNNQHITCAYCGTGYEINNKVLADIEIVKNILGRDQKPRKNS